MLYPALFASPRQLYGRKDAALGFDRGLTLSVTGEFTVSKLAILAAAAAILAPSPIALAEPSGGIAEEAEAMLMRAAAAVKADKAKALDLFNKGEGGFLDRDLYVFCVNLADGKEVAIGNPNTRKNLGNNIRAARDSTGKAFGQEIYAAVQKPEGQVTEVNYVWPRPGADKTPVPKVTLVTRVSDDLGCGVGYYK